MLRLIVIIVTLALLSPSPGLAAAPRSAALAARTPGGRRKKTIRRTTAGRTARAPASGSRTEELAERAARKAEREAARRAEERRRYDELRAAALAFLEEHPGGFYTDWDICQGIGRPEDLDEMCSLCSDLMNDRAVLTRVFGPEYEFAALPPRRGKLTERDELLQTPGVSLLATRRARICGSSVRLDLLRCTAPGLIECFVKLESTWKTGKLGENDVYLTEAEARGHWAQDEINGFSLADWAFPQQLMPTTPAPAVELSEEEFERREAALDAKLEAARAPARDFLLKHPGRFYTAAQVARYIGRPEDETDEALMDAMNNGEIDAEISRGAGCATWRYGLRVAQGAADAL